MTNKERQLNNQLKPESSNFTLVRLSDGKSNIDSSDYSHSIINKIAEISTNNIEGNGFKNFPKELKPFLYHWDLETKLSRIGKLLSSFGVVYCYILRTGRNPFSTWDFYYGNLIGISGDPKDPDMLTISLNNSHPYCYNGEEMSVIFEKKNNKVYMQYFSSYDIKNKKPMSESKVMEGLTRIPAYPIYNNSAGIPDWYYQDKMIAQNELYLNKLPQEKEYTKTLFTSLKKGKEQVEKIGNGERVMELANFDAKFGVNTGIMLSGSIALQQQQDLIKFQETLIFDHALIPTKSTDSGTNKHGAEMGLMNREPSNYFRSKIKQRNRDWTHLFNDIIIPLVKPEMAMKSPSAEPTKIEMNISDIENFIVKAMDPSIKNNIKQINPPKKPGEAPNQNLKK